MVKEREETDHSEDEEKRKRKRRWAAFKARAARIWSIGVMLIAFGIVGSLGHFVYKNLNDDEPGSKLVDATEYATCDPRNPNYNTQNCGSRPALPKTCEELGTCLQQLPVVEYGGDVKSECTAEVERLRKRNKPAQCFEILHLTNRALDGDSYTRSIASVSAGKSIVLTPFRVPDASINEYCRRFNQTDLDQANLLEKFFIHAFGLTKNPVCVEKENGELPDVNQDFELITREQYFEERARIRAGNQRSDWIGLAKTTHNNGESRLFSDVNAYLQEQEKLGIKQRSVLLYIHGFDTTFAASVETLAHLTADLNFQENLNPESERVHTLGVPVVLSWPTRLATDGIINMEVREAVELNYVESQLIASATAKQFDNLLSDLAANTAVTDINILAHSMGNRIFNEFLPRIESPILNSQGNPVSFRIVHAAADLGVAEFSRNLAQSEAITDVTYFSRSDVPLKSSTEIQLIKQIAHVVFASGRGDFEDKLSEFRIQLDENTEFGALRKRAIIDELREREARLADLVELSGLTIDEFLAEDDCRVGGGVEFADDCFNDLVSVGDRSSIIDASGFVPEVGKDFLFGAGHGYFWNSPAVVADISCAFRDEKIAPDGPRSIRARDFTPEDGNMRSYYEMDASVTEANDCAASNSKYIFERKAPTAAVPSIEPLSVFFRLNKASPAYTSPTIGGAKATEATSSLYELAQDASESDTERLVVRGYADASGDELHNENLSKRRADYVRTVIQDAGYPGEIETFGLGEFPNSDGINGIAPENRMPENRRVDISPE